MIDHAESIRVSLSLRRAAFNALRMGETQASMGNVLGMRRWLQTARTAMRRAVDAFKASRLTGHYVSTAGGWLAVVRGMGGEVASISTRIYSKRQSAQRAAKREAAYRMGLADVYALAWMTHYA